MSAVTLSVRDLGAARRLYEGLLGLRAVGEWTLADDADGSALRRLWSVPETLRARLAWLEAPGAGAGAVRLVQFDPVSPRCATDGARGYDYGLVKNLDFFTDDVQGAFERLQAGGVRFLAPPLTYPVPWGGAVRATEAHTESMDGVKLSLARLSGAPRRAYGEAIPEAPFTEVAAVAQVVADYGRAERFFCEALGCVPAADTVVDDSGLIAALGLPPRTRLRLAFIGPPDAVGGKVGLLAYEGPGVQDARSLAEQARPPHRGAVVQSFLSDDVDRRHSLSLLLGASEVAGPTELRMPPYGSVRASSLLSPDGLLLELVEPLPVPAPEDVPVLDASDLPPGALRSVSQPGLGRVCLANVAGQVFALEDRCPHLGGPLSRGVLRGREIVCPWHGWRIDAASGRVWGGAGKEAATRAVRRRGGQLCLRAGTGRTPR